MAEPAFPSVTDLGAAERRALGLLACEPRLTARALEAVAPSVTPEFWRASLAKGWVVDAGGARAFGARGPDGERVFALVPALRPLVLRELADREELEEVRRALRASSPDAARSGFIGALYAGDLGALERALPELARRAVRGHETTFATGMLREAIAASFDPGWLERTWGELGMRLIEQVLSDALFALAPVEALYHYARERLDEATPALRWTLAEHALLRGESEQALSFIAGFPSREQLGFRAALAYTSGAFAEAQRLLDDYDRAHGTAHGATSVTALLVLLALSREPPAGAKLARRCLPRRKERAAPLAGFPRTSAEPDVSRALRTLLKRATQPETERLRLSVHQLAATAAPWEALVNALTVALQERDEVARLGWARRLVAEAEQASAGGYAWFARQARHLARVLAREPLAELADLRPCQPGELLLCELLEPEPEWRRALGALQGFAESVESSERILSRRVAWYVDVTNGVPARPALEEFVRGTGWTRGRRVDLDELDAVKDELPSEDRAVLGALASLRPRRPAVLPLELLEQLIGHPRVFNGARGRLPVEIGRGTCRVETRREHGHLVISLEPAGATEGVNVVVESEARLVVYRVTPTLAKLFATVPSGVRIPERHEPEAIGVLSRLAEHVEVRSSSLGARRQLVADSTPVLRISPEAGAWYVEVGVRPFGVRGRFFPPGLGRAAITTHAGDDWLDAERDFEQEKSRFKALAAACPTLALALGEGRAPAEPTGDESFSGSLGEEGLFALLTELKRSELPVAFEWQDGRPVTARGTLTVGALHGALKRNKGWYLVTGGVRIDDVTSIELGELAALPYTKSGRFLRLPNGDFVEVERRARRVLSLLANATEAPRRGRRTELRIPEAALTTLRSLREAGYELTADGAEDDWLARCDRILATEPPLPSGLAASLRRYQLDGFRWLWRNSQLGLGVCLADDMGLGKTLEAIALLLTRSAGGPALVVAPTSVCSNWREELRRFAPSLTVLEYGGKARAALLEPAPHADVLIVSYALLQHDANELSSVKWNTVVLDEAQFIKNAHSLRARAAFALTARYRLALTGTPVENHLGDLWSIFHFLNPVLLGAWKHFQVRYLKPIERDRDSEQRAELKALLAPFLLRRVKSDVLSDLPPLTVVRHGVRLSEDEARRYALLRRQIHEKLRTAHGRREHKLEIFTEITRLRRFCCHPRLVFPDAPSDASKLTAFLELAEELRDNGHRALVFSQFVDFLALARELLDERGIRYSYLDGSTPKEARHARVEEFQNGDDELFLISLKAGGFGLNLTAADYVIHLDPWWNPAVEAQATDRAHRIGQARPVTVYRLIAEETIEERIVELHREKRDLAEALLAGTDDAPELGPELLAELLGSPAVPELGELSALRAPSRP